MGYTISLWPEMQLLHPGPILCFATEIFFWLISSAHFHQMIGLVPRLWLCLGGTRFVNCSLFSSRRLSFRRKNLTSQRLTCVNSPKRLFTSSASVQFQAERATNRSAPCRRKHTKQPPHPGLDKYPHIAGSREYPLHLQVAFPCRLPRDLAQEI
jgi:hypothetical protein